MPLVGDRVFHLEDGTRDEKGATGWPVVQDGDILVSAHILGHSLAAWECPWGGFEMINSMESVECLAISRGSGQPRDDGNSNLISLSSQVILITAQQKFREAQQCRDRNTCASCFVAPSITHCESGEGHKRTAEQVAVFPQKQAKNASQPRMQDIVP